MAQWWITDVSVLADLRTLRVKKTAGMKPAVLERLDRGDEVECHEGIQLPPVKFLILADVSQLLQTVSSGLGGHIKSVNHILDKAEVLCCGTMLLSSPVANCPRKRRMLSSRRLCALM